MVHICTSTAVLSFYLHFWLIISIWFTWNAFPPKAILEEIDCGHRFCEACWCMCLQFRYLKCPVLTCETIDIGNQEPSKTSVILLCELQRMWNCIHIDEENINYLKLNYLTECKSRMCHLFKKKSKLHQTYSVSPSLTNIKKIQKLRYSCFPINDNCIIRI